MDNTLRWRYRRHTEVLYLTAEYAAPDADYILMSRQGAQHSRAVRLPTLARLYDYLQTLEARLGADGWELLPADQRAPNRLRTPVCTMCPITVYVETAKRTATHVHFRCTGCGHTWVVPKPGNYTQAQTSFSEINGSAAP